MSCSKTDIAPIASAPIAIVSGGPPGASGAPVLARQAAFALGGHRVVRAVGGDDEVDYASSDNASDGEFILGVSEGAALAGAAIGVRTAGELTEPSWTWTPGPVFCGLTGLLTQTAPTSGFLRQIGIADAPDRIVIDLRPTIIL